MVSTSTLAYRLAAAGVAAVLATGCAVAEQPDAGFRQSASTPAGPRPASTAAAQDRAPADGTGTAEAIESGAPGADPATAAGETPVTGRTTSTVGAAAPSGAAPRATGPPRPTETSPGGGSATPAAPSPDTGPVTAGPDNSDVGVTGGTIRVGAILPLSGPIGPYGKPWLEALQTPFRHANDRGGVNGRRFRFIFCDDAFSGERGLACAKKLVDEDQVFIVMADGSAAGSQGALPYLTERGIPVGNSVGLNPADFESPLVFPIGASAPNQARLMARFTGQELSARTAGIIVLGDVQATADSARAFREAASDYGFSVTVEARINFQDADCSPQVVQMQTKAPDTVFLALDAATVIKCFAAANNLGYKPPKQFTSFVYTYLDLVPQYGGAAAQGHYTMTLNHTPDTTDNAFIAEYLERTAAYYPRHSWWSQTPAFYGGAVINVDVIRSLGRNVTRQRYLDAMNRLTNALPDLGVDVTFRPGPHNPVARAIVLQIQGQRFVPVTPFLTDKAAQ